MPAVLPEACVFDAYGTLFDFASAVARCDAVQAPHRDPLIKLLPPRVRSDVIKSTAILRVGRALNQGRRASVKLVRVSSRDEQITVNIKAGRVGADLELWAGEKEVP